MQPTIEVAIGLTLLMVVFSVLVSATLETVSMVLSKRAKDLELGITRMLSADDRGATASALGASVLAHPLVAALGKERRRFGVGPKRLRPPSYLPPDIFSAAVIDGLLDGVEQVDDVDDAVRGAIAGLPDGPLKKRLQTVHQQAGASVADLRVGLEVWFDHQMDRVSGWYTRWAQVVMLFVGVAAALLLNVSAVTVARVLWNDPVLRTELVTEAETAGEDVTGESPRAADPPSTAVGSEVELSRFPMGWNDTAWPGLNWYLGLHLMGVVAVGLAASLGAPFWFDTLSRFSNLRSVGPRPAPAARAGTATGVQIVNP